jgi:hypothetical protein
MEGVETTNAPETSKSNATGNRKKRTNVRKKKSKVQQPSITAHIPPYNIVADLQQQNANITFGQLFSLSPKLRAEVNKSLRKPAARSAKFAHQDTNSTTAMYCDATVQGVKIPLIIDMGAAGSIVTCRLLQEAGIAIDRPSTTVMINMNGERNRPLGEVLDVPITIQGITIPINMVVVDADSYSAIVGNDWLAKAQASVDFPTATLSVVWNNQEVDILIEYRMMPHERPRIESVEDKEEDIELENEDSEDEETEEEYKNEDLDEKSFFSF